MKGELRGQLVGRRQLLREQLEARFGPVSAEAKAKLEQAGAKQLQRWAKKILFASDVHYDDLETIGRILQDRKSTQDLLETVRPAVRGNHDGEV